MGLRRTGVVIVAVALALVAVGCLAVYAQFRSLDPTQPPAQVPYCGTAYHRTVKVFKLRDLPEPIHRVGTWINGSAILAADASPPTRYSGVACPLDAYLRIAPDSYLAYLRWGGP